MKSLPDGAQRKTALDPGNPRDAETIPALLRLLGAGAPGSILLALGDGPLQTKDLVKRVPGYAPRTIYRYVTKVVEIGAIRREVEPGVPSKVVHHLTDPCGADLCRLIDLYATMALEALPSGGFVPHSWGSLASLTDLWETGMYEELTFGPCTATELARGGHELSFHQVNRRIDLFLLCGLIREADDGDRRRHYELTDEGRQATALIAGLGRWRELHVVAAGEAGLTVGEAMEVLQAALPLVVLPDQAGKTIELTVLSKGEEAGEDSGTVKAQIDASGMIALALAADAGEAPDGSCRGSVQYWIQALLDREPESVTPGKGDVLLMEEVLLALPKALWAPHAP